MFTLISVSAHFLLISPCGCEHDCCPCHYLPLASFQPHHSNAAITMSVFIICCNNTFPERPVAHSEIK